MKIKLCCQLIWCLWFFFLLDIDSYVIRNNYFPVPKISRHNQQQIISQSSIFQLPSQKFYLPEKKKLREKIVDSLKSWCDRSSASKSSLNSSSSTKLRSLSQKMPLLKLLLPIIFFFGMGSLKSMAKVPANGWKMLTASSLAASGRLTSQLAMNEMQSSLQKLVKSFQGVKFDSLLMLLATSIVIPVFKRLNYSPIIGFLLMGTILGPNGFNLVRDLHMIDVLGELGIIFFLFEMGLELSLERLSAMKRDVFGLGSLQFLVTSFIGTILVKAFSGLSLPGAFTIASSLALSSSAFVLQLLKDSDAMGSRHGKASFGILLLQDLAVVPLLIIVQLLSEGGAGIQRALLIAATKAVVTLSTMSLLGHRFLDPLFSIVAKSKSHEAFLSIILTTVFLMSFLTEGIGLSHTLGAFLAGILLSETRYRYQIEADIAPFRGLLLGIFFMTVGFSIDFKLVFREGRTILSLLSLLIGLKAGVIFLLCLFFGLPIASAIITGLLNSQGGEFAFVSLGIAQSMGLIPELLSKKLLTTVALSMAITPMLSDLASFLSKQIEERTGYTHYAGQEEVSSEFQKDFIVVCGYGRIGKVICQLLDRKFLKYLVFDNSPQVAIEARNRGLPVFYGDANRPEMLKHFNVGKAKVCIVTFDEIAMINKAVVKLRKSYPDLPIVVRAKSDKHRQRLESMFDNVTAISPPVEEESTLLFLPFCSAMLEKIGVSRPEVEVMVEDVRKQYLERSPTVGVFNSLLNSFRGSTSRNTEENNHQNQTMTTQEFAGEKEPQLIETEEGSIKVKIENE